MIKITFIVTLDEGVTPEGAVAIAEDTRECMEPDDDIKNVTYIIEDDN